MRAFLRKAAKLLLRGIIAAALLGTIAVSVYANSIFPLSSDGYGGTTWLSCGSSAGNYTFTCDASGCSAMYDDPWGSTKRRQTRRVENASPPINARA